MSKTEEINSKQFEDIKINGDVSNEGFKSPSLISNDEFFDADDGIDKAQEDEEDFFKELENAISGSELKASKPLEIGSTDPEISSNDVTKKLEQLEEENNTSIFDNDSTDNALKINGVCSTDSDAERLENELLKDSEDDDLTKDLKALKEEADDLLCPDTDDNVRNQINDEKLYQVKSNEKSEKEAQEDPLESDLLDEAAEALDEIINDIESNNIKEVDQLLVKEPLESHIPTPAISPKPMETDEAKTVEEDPKGDDLLVACESPHRSETAPDQENTTSESSSNAGDNPEDSSDEKQRSTETESADGDQMEKSAKNTEVIQLEGMQVDEIEVITNEDPRNAEDDVHLSIAQEESSSESSRSSLEKEQVQFKMKFMRKFSSAVGVLSRAELEELLIQKISESCMFCSENTELRTRIEKQEKSCETFKKQLENLKKQYNDLEMIHNRVKKDLQDRPSGPVAAVKITRAVGLQVFSPAVKIKQNSHHQNLAQTSIKPFTNKRPASELEQALNGKSPENVKRKKTTPLRPMLSDQERKLLENQEAKREQDMRSTLIGSSAVKLSPNVTISPLITSNGPATSASHSSIDLTDEEESNQTPPALVAIRAQNTSPRRVFVAKSTLNHRSNSQIALAMNRAHPAPLPTFPPNHVNFTQGMKKIPPPPNIKINNVSSGIIVSWIVSGLNSEHADIYSYQIYAYEVTSALPKTENWKHVGDVKALPLPMAVTLTQFQEGQKYYFSVRAIDVHKRSGAFAVAKTWSG